MKTPSINTAAGAQSVPAIDHPKGKKTLEKCGRRLLRHVQTGTIYYHLKRHGKIKRRRPGTTKISEVEARALDEADLEANSDPAEASKYYRRTFPFAR